MGSILTISAQGRRQARIDASRLEFKRLSPDCERKAFVCGFVHIEKYFEHRAYIDHCGLYAGVITVHIDDRPEPVGFYAMTIQSEPEDLFTDDNSFFSNIARRFSKRSLLVVHLKWVAVSFDFQRMGIGTLLMGRALDDFYQVTDRTGIAALTLSPIDENAASFYRSLGFEPYGTSTLRSMYLPAEVVMLARNGSAGAA
jgi:GNAT superfamily N-acetyltransferase